MCYTYTVHYFVCTVLHIAYCTLFCVYNVVSGGVRVYFGVFSRGVRVYSVFFEVCKGLFGVFRGL